MKREWWQYALAAVAALLALWLLVAILSFRPPDAELARTVREALRMAHGAYRDADAARRGSSAFRLIAMVIGMTAPLIVAYLIYRLHLGSEPRPPGMLDAMEHERLEVHVEKQSELPFPAMGLPEKTTEVEEADRD